LEVRPGSDDLRRIEIARGPPSAGPLPQMSDEIALGATVDLPELLIADLVNRLPGRGVITLLAPVRTDLLIEKARHRRRGPRREMDAVGDVGHRHLIWLLARPEIGPHRPRDLAVPLADGVPLIGEPERQRGHVE